jgi:hypothetical protein
VQNHVALVHPAGLSAAWQSSTNPLSTPLWTTFR